MIYREEIKVKNKKFIDKLLSYQPESENDMLLTEDETYTETAIFPNGYFMDIKICGVQYQEGEDNRPWCEAVLFDEKGREIACTDADDEFFGEWEIEADDDTYRVDTYIVNVR